MTRWAGWIICTMLVCLIVAAVATAQHVRTFKGPSGAKAVAPAANPIREYRGFRL